MRRWMCVVWMAGACSVEAPGDLRDVDCVGLECSDPSDEANEPLPVATPTPGSVEPGEVTQPAVEGTPSGEAFADWGIHPWLEVVDSAVSTFALDVDSASYSLMRSSIAMGTLPPPESVRAEEYVNYFRYDELHPIPGQPFVVQFEMAPSPFGPSDRQAHLLRIGVAADRVELQDRLPANLVFLIDVSGSMAWSGKLELAKFALGELLDRLEPTDTLSIVTYAGTDSVLLHPTPVSDKSAILSAIQGLQSGGGTAGEAGIRTAYAIAQTAMRPEGINRVVLCTDGDFNVGMTGESLIQEVERNRDEGVFLTTLGFGRDNLDDGFMEQLADRGNGNYAFIDGENEARRVLGQHLVSTLQVVAKDAKVQVHFEPERVHAWRLIGYENRLLEEDEFDDDTVDGGELGAGHNVTALYEVELTASTEGPLATIDMRYKEPDEDISTELGWVLDDTTTVTSFDDASRGLRFSAAVAEYAEILRESPHSEGARFAEVHDVAALAYPASERSPVKDEFLELVIDAEQLWGAP